MSSSLDVLDDEEQRLADLDHGLENRQQLERGELLLVDEDVGISSLGHHLFGAGDEIGREVA
jgi:hypothetical protein